MIKFNRKSKMGNYSVGNGNLETDIITSGLKWQQGNQCKDYVWGRESSWYLSVNGNGVSRELLRSLEFN